MFRGKCVICSHEGTRFEIRPTRSDHCIFRSIKGQQLKALSEMKRFHEFELLIKSWRSRSVCDGVFVMRYKKLQKLKKTLAILGLVTISNLSIQSSVVK
mmetsp:Transcript_11395/g.17438  ORF Transcript_11395/g.17438 Transcript_11395/m.17438 type:complete len:99 (-) Transcript_11395:1482-1778(-)